MPSNTTLTNTAADNVDPSVAAASATTAAATAATTTENAAGDIAPNTVYPHHPNLPDTSDDNSLSTEALLESGDQGNVGDDASNTPGKCELFVTNDANIPRQKFTQWMLFLAKGLGINVDSELSEVLKRKGNGQLSKVTKAMIAKEAKRRDSNLRLNPKNKSVPELWDLLPELTDQRDIDFIRSRYASIKEGLFAAAREADAEASDARRQGSDVMRVFLLILEHADLRRAYMLSQDSSDRQMLDAGETHMSQFLKLLVQYFNDASKTVSTPILPYLHSSFSDPIVCNKGDYELTEEKAKKILADSRRILTTMINNWEKSGNGSSQRRHDDDEEEHEIDPELWGHFDQEAEHFDADDRKNFLQHHPFYWLMVWHLCDECNLLRFTCAQLPDDHGASSTSTPNAVSRARGTTTSAHKLAKQSFELQQQIASSVKKLGRAIAANAAHQDETFERVSKIRRLDDLKGERYLVYKDSLICLDREQDATKAYLDDLDQRIANIEKDLEDMEADS